jgi:hypothetical protein
MIIVDVIFGCLLLFAGRKLFWLAVGIIGFLTGVHLGYHWAAQTDNLTIITVALLMGILGAMLAVAFEWMAVVIMVGFLGGGYFLMNILALTPSQQPFEWMVFLIGGIVGMIVVVFAFDWALIIISSLLGAMLLVQHLAVTESVRLMVFAGSVLVGVLLQCVTREEEVNEDE